MNFRHAAKLAALFGLALTNAGCVTTVIGGLLPSNNKVVIDETTVSPELRDAFVKAKRLAFLSADKSDTAAGEYLEQHGGYEVSLIEAPKEATLSQKRRQMNNVCASTDRPDLVFAWSAGESDAGTGTTITGLFTGRADFKISGTGIVLRCRDRWESRYSVQIEIAQGIYNADTTTVQQVVGQEYAKALMRLAGKLPPLAATNSAAS